MVHYASIFTSGAVVIFERTCGKVPNKSKSRLTFRVNHRLWLCDPYLVVVGVLNADIASLACITRVLFKWNNLDLVNKDFFQQVMHWNYIYAWKSMCAEIIKCNYHIFSTKVSRVQLCYRNNEGMLFIQIKWSICEWFFRPRMLNLIGAV